MLRPILAITKFLCVLVSAGSVLVANAQERPYFNDKNVPDTMEDLLAIQASLHKNLERVRRSTVSITDGKGFGSGVIISKDGLVMTAAHVTGAVNKEFTVIMEDGKKLKARSLGLDSASDSALLQITEKGVYDFVEVDRNKKDKITTRLGDWAFSVAHPGGYDKVRGSVVRIARVVRMAESPPTFQTDGTLIGGDSGGPLFNINGVLIGIHSRVGAVLDQNNSVATYDFFSKRSEEDKETKFERMLKGEFMGTGPFAKPPVAGKGFMGFAVNEESGTLKVSDVDETSPAGAAGVKVGDVLVSLDGKAMKLKADITAFMKTKTTGGKVVIIVLRDGKEVKYPIFLAER